MFHTLQTTYHLFICVYTFVCLYVCVGVPVCIHTMYMWRVPLTSAPGQPEYQTQEHHNFINPDTAFANASKNCKGSSSL
jgi:hypothetical protein